MLGVILLALVVSVIILNLKNAGRPKNVAWYIIVGGLAFGIVGLVLGLLGALVLAPGNNMAPIIGFIFTGPLGFVIGLFAGYLYWKRKIAPHK